MNICANCKEEFHAKKTWHRYCHSPACQEAEVRQRKAELQAEMEQSAELVEEIRRMMNRNFPPS